MLGGALAIFLWKMLPLLVDCWPRSSFCLWQKVEPGGRRWNRTTDTGIFNLIVLPVRIDNSHGYSTFEEMP